MTTTTVDRNRQTGQNDTASPTAWADESAGMPRLSLLATGALLLIGLAGLILLVVSTRQYIGSAQARTSLQFDFAWIEVIDDDNPRAVMRFTLHNSSPLPLEAVRYGFFLYLNNELVGASHSQYLGTDPETDPSFYTEARTLNRTLGPGETLELDFTLYIYPAQMEIIRQAQESGQMHWRAQAAFHFVFPYTHEEDAIWLNATYPSGATP